MKRRNFIRLGAGVPLIIHTPVFGQTPGKDSENPDFNGDLPDGQPFLKVKTGPNVTYDWCRRKVMNISSLKDYLPAKDTNLSPWGGNMDHDLGGTGYFRTGKISDRWYMIDADGHPFISAGFNSVEVRDGNEEMVVGTLRDAGATTIGCWSDYEKLRKAKDPLPYSVSLNLMHEFMQRRPKKENHGTGWKRRYPNLTISVFHPDFETFADRYAKSKIGDLKNDPYCIGYFSDNELPFLFDALDRYLELPEHDHGHQAALKWLTSKGIPGRNAITHDDRMEFLGSVADRYYSVCNKYIKKYDPNHLYLGSRLHGYDISLLRSTTSVPVFKAAGNYADVVSVNLYGTIGLSPAELDRYSEWAGKPVHITEFYAKGMDSGLENNEGAGQIVPTQTDRGIFYQNFTLSLLQSKGCTGWDWHRYIDPETSNKGLVNKNYEVYSDFQRKVKELNEQKYSLADYFHTKHPTGIVKNDRYFILYRHGAPFTIKGQEGVKNPDRLIDAHGNAVKIYNDSSYDLDYLESKNIGALFTIDLKNYGNAAMSQDVQRMNSEKDKVLNTIEGLKHHPSIMIWGLGNNTEFMRSPAELNPYWENLNRLVREVKNLDPDHPVITAIHETSLDYLRDIAARVPEIHAIGININDQNIFEALPEKLSEAGWNKPFIVTDFTYASDCDILKAPFNIPSWIERNEGSVLEQDYRRVIINHPQCLGGFMLT